MPYNNADKKKNWTLKKRYAINLVQFKKMLSAQKNCCAVCGILFEHRRVNVDHDHKNKRVRGLLCYHCNNFRVAGNTLETALSVVEYLKRERALGL